MSSSREASMQSGSLYRKYRPQTFEELVGQEAIARTLRNAVALGRVAHAYLFCGPRGTGKTSTARLLAKAVNCLEPDPWRRPCNRCAACRAIASGAAVDIVEIDAASNRGVDDIRDLREKVKYAPVELRTKFYIIDEAHQLTRDAFNAFLKTLEEPPPHVVFVLATTEPDKLPDTVASRCQRFDFRRLPVDQVVERLRFVCTQEGIPADEATLALIARRATGSLRDALGLLERLVVFAGESAADGPITLELALQVLGGSRQDRLAELVAAIADRDAGRALRTIAAVADAGDDLQQFSRDLVAYVRDLLHLRAGGRDPVLREDAAALAQRFSLGELAAVLRRLTGFDLPLPRSGVDPQLVLELAVVEAILALDRPRTEAVRPAPSEPASQVRPVAAAPHAEPPPSRRDGDGHAPVAPEAPRVRPSGVQPVSGSDDATLLEQLLLRWAAIRRELRSANSKAAALLADAEPRLIRGEEVILAAPYEFHRKRINEEAELRHVIERVLARHLGRACRVVCVAPEELPMLQGRREGETRSVDAEQAGEEAESVPDDPVPSLSPALSPDDLRRLEAAKAIFDAVELT
ncbi:MAG: DNA polymerase III subunit gamma/tau [Thermomicrobium sp.]|nr:DNA polymerase III subunit gamma/tau [Thermomicrobium sp.]